MSELTAKQARFIDEYLVDGNGTRAAVAAGYGRAGARVTACRTLANPNVRALIEERQAEDARRLQIEREGLIAALLEAFNIARANQEPAAMVSACRELGRMLGMYPSEHRQVKEAAERSVASQSRWEGMSDVELMAEIAGG